jgi:hypothetical protein
LKKLAVLIAAAMIWCVGFFALKKQRKENELDHDLAETGAHLDNPSIDERWLHRQRYDGTI